MVNITNHTAAAARATQRAIEGNFKVIMVVFREYFVTNRDNGKVYNVRFDSRDGQRLATCDCPAGKKNMLCKHVTASVGLHMYVARNRARYAQ